MTDEIDYVAPSDGKFIFRNVSHNGRVYSRVTLFEELSPTMNFEKLLMYHETEKKKGNPSLMDLPWHISLFEKAHGLRETHPDKSGRFRNFVQGVLRSQYPYTTTSVDYVPEEKDIVWGYKGTSDKYSVSENIIGPDREIVSVDAEAVTALTSNSNLEQVKNVLSWINGKTPVWIWRVNSKPKTLDERAVGLGAGSVRLGLGADGYPAVLYPAFRVLIED